MISELELTAIERRQRALPGYVAHFPSDLVELVGQDLTRLLAEVRDLLKQLDDRQLCPECGYTDEQPDEIVIPGPEAAP